MPTAIPDNITEKEILEGMRLFDANHPHTFSDSTTYDLLVDGRRYPPKAIIGLAGVPLLGKPLLPSDFSGGAESKCFRILERERFTIVPKLPPAGWIFQGNAQYFRLDDYLRIASVSTWSIGQKHFVPFMRPAQRVFLWRSKVGSALPSGVIAAGVLRDEPAEIEEFRDAIPFWTDPKQATGRALRAVLRVEHLFLEPQQTLRRETIASEPSLRNLRLLRMANETNYALQEHQVRRIDELLGTAPASSLRPTYRHFGEAPNDDLTQLRWFATTIRRGQDQFRRNLLRLYDGKCAISGTAVPEVLEACHIWVHNESGNNHSENGILLRSDLHQLFDEGLISINPETLAVVVDCRLRSSEYGKYHGVALAQRTDGSSVGKKFLVRRHSLSRGG